MSLRVHFKANECQYWPIWSVQELFYYIAKHFSVNLHNFWVKFISKIILHLTSISATALLPSWIEDIFVKKYKKLWLIDKSLWTQLIHTYYRCKKMLLSYLDDNIPTSTTIFVYSSVFNIARSVRNISGCTLLHDVNVQFCTLKFSRFYVDFTIHYFLAI